MAVLAEIRYYRMLFFQCLLFPRDSPSELPKGTLPSYPDTCTDEQQSKTSTTKSKIRSERPTVAGKCLFYCFSYLQSENVKCFYHEIEKEEHVNRPTSWDEKMTYQLHLSEPLNLLVVILRNNPTLS